MDYFLWILFFWDFRKSFLCIWTLIWIALWQSVEEKKKTFFKKCVAQSENVIRVTLRCSGGIWFSVVTFGFAIVLSQFPPQYCVLHCQKVHRGTFCRLENLCFPILLHFFDHLGIWLFALECSACTQNRFFILTQYTVKKASHSE